MTDSPALASASPSATAPATALALNPADQLELGRMPLECRTDVEAWLQRLRIVARRIQDGERICTVMAQEARVCAIPVSTFRRQWDRLRVHGWRGLVNRAKFPVDRNVGLPPLFVKEWNKILLLHQRDTAGRQARRVLLARWRAWRGGHGLPGDESAAIPGYDHAPAPEKYTGYPLGWSLQNLMRNGPSRYEKALRRQGTMAAKALLPSIRTTRVGMEVGQMYMPDDQWHDTYVNLIGREGEVINKRAMRPISFNMIDVLSGCDFTRGHRPIIWDDVSKSKKMFAPQDFFWFLIHVLSDYGWRSDIGTVIVMEHGTATVNDLIRRAITAHTEGKVTFQLGGIGGDPLKGLFYEGQSRGNFKVKAHRESWFNLFRNYTSALLGPTGLSPEMAPEESHGLLRYNQTLLKAMKELGPKRAALLRMPILNWFDYVPIANTITECINQRSDHELEGWAEMGFIAQDVRLNTTSDHWLSLSDIHALPDPTAQQLALSLMTVEGHRRDRRLSPREVFDQGRREGEFKRLNPHFLNQVVPKDKGYFHELRVNERHEILVPDADRPGVPLCYPAMVTNYKGREETLHPGDEVRVYVNPFSPQQALICEPNDAAIGLATQMVRPMRGDADAMARNAGMVSHLEAHLNRAARHQAADLAAERAELHEHNERVIQGEPVTEAEHASAARMRKAKRRTADALDAEPVGAPSAVAEADQPERIDPLDR